MMMMMPAGYCARNAGGGDCHGRDNGDDDDELIVGDCDA